MAGYLLDGIITVQLLTTLPASPTAPTQAESGGGTALVGSKQLEELIQINGWQKTSESIPTPGYAGTDVGSLAGASTFGASNLVHRADNSSEVIFTALAETTTLQWVAISQQGLGVGNRSKIFPVTIPVQEEAVDRNVPHSFRTDFSVTVPYVSVQVT